MVEICHGVEPFMQPSPHLNPGGDCFACSLYAVIRHLFPDECPDFERVWHYWDGESGGTHNSWPGLYQALLHAVRDENFDLRLEYHFDLLVPHYDPERSSHSFWTYYPTNPYPSHEWALRLESWLAAGWIAIAEMDFAGRGPISDGQPTNTDHFYVIDGIRPAYKDLGHIVAGASKFEPEAHCVCSARGAYWIPIVDLLEKHGTAGLCLVRRRP